jgi:hypothetical protein
VLFCESVSLGAILLATRPLQAKQLSQPVRLSLQPFCAGDVFLRAARLSRCGEISSRPGLAMARAWSDSLNPFLAADGRRVRRGLSEKQGSISDKVRRVNAPVA